MGAVMRGFPAEETPVLPRLHMPAVIVAALEVAVQAFAHGHVTAAVELAVVEGAFPVAALQRFADGVATQCAGPHMFFPAKEPVMPPRPADTGFGWVDPGQGAVRLRGGLGAPAGACVAAVVMVPDLRFTAGVLVGDFPPGTAPPRVTGTDPDHQAGTISVTLNSTRTQLRTFPPPVSQWGRSWLI